MKLEYNPCMSISRDYKLKLMIFYDVPKSLKCKYSSYYTGPDHRLLQTSQPPCKTYKIKNSPARLVLGHVTGVSS
jgi:hypothetical protein